MRSFCKCSVLNALPVSSFIVWLRVTFYNKLWQQDHRAGFELLPKMTDMHHNRTLTDALVFPHILQLWFRLCLWRIFQWLRGREMSVSSSARFMAVWGVCEPETAFSQPSLAKKHCHRGKRKRGTKKMTAKKCLRHFGDCDILNIKKDICVNRCPTGDTDRRLAWLVSYSYSRILWSGGRLFLCLVTILTDRVSYSEAGQAKAQHRYKS